MSSKKKTPKDLWEFCQVTTTIECMKCNAVGGGFGEELEVSDNLFKKGWRATPNKVYCPKCAKKYLKK